MKNTNELADLLLISMRQNGPLVKKRKYRYSVEDIKDEKHLKSWARTQVHWAVKRGDLHKPNQCHVCGNYCHPEGHHIDYRKPLDVVWVCRPCHGKVENHPELIPEKPFVRDLSEKRFSKRYCQYEIAGKRCKSRPQINVVSIVDKISVCPQCLVHYLIENDHKNLSYGFKMISPY